MKRFATFLFFILITELALGGGGRLTAIGPISLRMILFAVALVSSGVFLINERKLPKDYAYLLLFFALLSFIGLFFGIHSSANPKFIWEDIKPLLYFLILPFFCFSVREIRTLEQTSTILKAAGTLLAVAFFTVLLLIHLHVVPFLTIYHLLISTQEFFFRGELTFTYKGFLFLCIGFLFFHFTGGKYKFLFMAILLVAILFTVTRGFWVALLGTYFIFYFTKQDLKVKVRATLFALLAIGVVALGQLMISKTSEAIDQIKSSPSPSQSAPRGNLLGDRAYSDEGRFQQAREVMNDITPVSILVGHGFGKGIPARPIHMEISYLEIFHKQGLLGLVFWLYLLLLVVKKYRTASPGGLRDSFFFSSLFIFLQSFTNQYMNNPIGLSMILLSLVSLDVLRKPIN